jgi:hypothetical protein
MKDITIFGTGLNSTSFAISPEDRLNCYYEVRQGPEGTRYIVQGTPGSQILWTLPTGPVRGWRVVGTVLYVVVTGFLFTVSQTGTMVKVGALSTTSGVVSMADTYTQLGIVDGTAGYAYNIASATLTVITDGNFPNGATTITVLSSRFIVEKPNTREFYCSAILDGLTWTYISLPIFGTKEQYSDLLSAVDAFNGVLILWGTASIEFWQDAGTSPQPFSLIQGATRTYGLAAKASRAAVNNELLFLGVGIQGGYTIFSTSGYDPKRVSTPDVEALLAQLAISFTLADAVAMTYSVNGHDMYQLTFPTANITLLYAVDTRLWSYTQTGMVKGRHFGQTSVKFAGLTLFCDSTTGNIYQMSTLAYSDAGQPIVRQITSRSIRNGGNEFAITELQLLMDTGVMPQGSDYHISLEVSRDGGRTFGSPRPRTMGYVGQYRTPRVKWDRMGSARDFVLRLTMADPVPFVIAGESIETTAK